MEDPKILTPTEAHQLVQDVVRAAWNTVIERTEGYHPTQRYLIMNRVTGWFVGQLYTPIMQKIVESTLDHGTKTDRENLP